MSRDCHTVVTWWSHDCHMVVMWRSHDVHVTVCHRYTRSLLVRTPSSTPSPLPDSADRNPLLNLLESPHVPPSTLEQRAVPPVVVESTKTEDDQESDIASPTIVSADWTGNDGGGGEVEEDHEDAFAKEGSGEVIMDKLKVLTTIHRIDSVEEGLQDHPAFLFLIRPDFYEYVQVSILHGLTIRTINSHLSWSLPVYLSFCLCVCVCVSLFFCLSLSLSFSISVYISNSIYLCIN